MQSYQLGEQICQEPAPPPNAQVICRRRRLPTNNDPGRKINYRDVSLLQNCKSAPRQRGHFCHSLRGR